MPGIVGYVKENDDEAAEAFLTAMVRRLEPETKNYRVDSYHDRYFGVGRVGLGILNPEPQPCWSRDRNLCLMMVGEVFDSGELRAELGSRGCQLTGSSDAELMLCLFETFGEEFAAKLNGAFMAAVWDRRARRLTITNDRLGLFPVYYAVLNNHLFFSSGIRALLAETRLSRTVDKLALAQFLTFDHMLDDRTLLSGVRLLPQASVLSFSDGNLQISPYWRLRYPTVYQNCSQEDLLDELTSKLRQAVRRQAPENGSSGLLLSGGLDSRLLLAFLRDATDISQFHTFTWGIPGCDDARTARELASLTKTRHHFFELESDYLLRTAEEAVRITEGNGNLVNLHALATLEATAAHAKIIYKGFLGDAMMGYALQRPFWAEYGTDTAQEVHLSVHESQGVLNYNADELKKLVADDFGESVCDAVFYAYREGMLRSGSSQLSAQRLYFDLTQRVPRMTLNGVEVVRSLAAVRLPFADKDLVDFSISLPPGYHFERHLVRLALIRCFPEYAKIPVTDTGLPMISCARELRLRAMRFARWHLRNTGIKWLDRPEVRHYKDYSAWFRTVLKTWVEDKLLSSRALERGYFNPEYVKRLVGEHMGGADHTVRLGALLTLEMWHRRFLD